MELYDKLYDFLYLASAEEIKEYSDNKMDITDKGTLKIKGSFLPDNIAKKVKEYQKQKLPFKPLLRFWEKLKKNPDKSIVNRLFSYMDKNKMPIFPDGDFMAYKGVTDKGHGKYVDTYSKKFDNSIGETVKMPRYLVDKNHNITCSTGLHVASHHYAKYSYGGHLIEVKVNPKNVCAVPYDYDESKIRVCEYICYNNGKTDRNDLLVLDSIKKSEKDKNSQKSINTGDIKYLSAREIIKMVKDRTGKVITCSEKSKKSVIRWAEKYLKEYDMTLNLKEMPASKIIELVKKKTKGKITCSPKSKKTVIKQATPLLEKAGYIIS